MSSNPPSTLRWTDVGFEEASGIRLHSRSTDSTPEAKRYFQLRVAARIKAGRPVHVLNEMIDDLTDTDFDATGLAEVSRRERHLRPSDVGETLAEVLLEDHEAATFPWPTNWDKRNEAASLQGPDLVGFQGHEGSECFLFGEVKTPEQDKGTPPTLVTKSPDGLRYQIHDLVTKAEKRTTLITWLQVRAANSTWKPKFDRALRSYVQSPSQAIVAGVLLRDMASPVADLEPVRVKIVDIRPRHDVRLWAFGLPIPVNDWPAALEESA